MKTKTCSKCGIEKPLDAEHYYKDSTKSSGWVSQCKVCKAEYNSRPEVKKRRAEYRAERYSRPEVKEKIAKQQAEYRQNNKERISKYKAEYYQNNKEEIAKQTTEYNSRPEVKERKAEYYSRPEVKERISKYNTEYNREKNLEQPACVYQIVNTANNKVYIGQTTQGELRWKRHTSALRGKYHGNHKLQADFNKFGEAAFEWSIIKEYPKDKAALLLEEARTIVKYRKEGKDLYNITLTVDQVQLLEENK